MIIECPNVVVDRAVVYYSKYKKNGGSGYDIERVVARWEKREEDILLMMGFPKSRQTIRKSLPLDGRATKAGAHLSSYKADCFLGKRSLEAVNRCQSRFLKAQVAGLFHQRLFG